MGVMEPKLCTFTPLAAFFISYIQPPPPSFPSKPWFGGREVHLPFPSVCYISQSSYGLSQINQVDSTVLILIPAILVHVSGQVAFLLHLSGYKTSDSPGLNLITAILVLVSGQVAILLHLSGHKTSDSPGLNLISAILVHVSGQVAIFWFMCQVK
jgi:hypothetical protein